MDKMIAQTVDDAKRIAMLNADRIDAHDEHMTKALLTLATTEEAKANMTAFAAAYAAATAKQDKQLEDIHSSVGTLVKGSALLGVLGIGYGGNSVLRKKTTA